MTIDEFLKADADKINEILEKYPRQIPVAVVAELVGMDLNSLRCAIAKGNEHLFGFCWQKTGKTNQGFAIPTAPFVRRWLNMREI